jgi:hypothetical protein
MSYELGDIFDARSHELEHFVLVVGEVPQGSSSPKGILFYRISSRTYKVFKDILSFFNDCIDEDYGRFYRFFGKEKNKRKEKKHIFPAGQLCDSFFLDKDKNYPLCLDVDSVVVLNRDPEVYDEPVFERFRKSEHIIYKGKLCKADIYKFVDLVKHSQNISARRKDEIMRHFKT